MVDVFEIIGPIMIGPSSSHTAGAVRLGKLASSIFGSVPDKVEIYLHGSFAKTYKGHGTDVALIAGVMGMDTDDTRIPNALEIAKKNNLEVKYIPTDLGKVHPNTVMFVMEKKEKKRTILGSSVGGGNIKIVKIDDFSVNLKGDYHTLIIRYEDRLGFIAKVCELLAERKINIAKMSVSRDDEGDEALMVVEIDSEVGEDTLGIIRKIEGIKRPIYIQPI